MINGFGDEYNNHNNNEDVFINENSYQLEEITEEEQNQHNEEF